MSNSSVATTAISAAIGGGTIIFFMAHPLSGAVVGGTLVGYNTFHLVKKLFTKKEPQAKS